MKKPKKSLDRIERMLYYDEEQMFYSSSPSFYTRGRKGCPERPDGENEVPEIIVPLMGLEIWYPVYTKSKEEAVMTTTYYTFQTRKVKVSGGPELLSLVPVAHAGPQEVSADGKVLSPKAFGGDLPRTGSKTGAEILDFDFCRRHMETKKAWKALAQAAEEEEQSEEELWDERWEVADRPEGEEPRASHKWQVSEGLELIASGAVIVTALSAAAAFLSLL